MAEIDLGIEGLSDYTVVGSGGFATVYSAYEVEADRIVAVKVFNSIDDRARRQFDRERRTMGPTTQHPNIVMMLRAGYTNPEARPFLVLEHMGRGSLQNHLDEVGPMPMAEAIDAIIPIAEALGFAHSSGIVHKDVKPDNLLVDRFGVVKLADFGIAEIKEATAASQVAFSLSYAPPEAFGSDLGPDGKVVDPRDERSDLYSLGVTLYSLVAGEPPFGGSNSAALMKQILSDPVPSVAGLDAFFAVALAKDPNDRYQTSTAFVAALRAIPEYTSSRSDQPTEVAADNRSIEHQQTKLAAGNHSFQNQQTKPKKTKGILVAGAVAAVLLVVGALTWVSTGGDPETSLASKTTSEQESASSVTSTASSTTVVESDVEANESIERGDAHFNAGSFEAAVEDYDQAIILDPSNADGFRGRGYAYIQLGEYERAIEDFDQAITLDPTNTTSFVHRGLAYRGMKEYARAIKDFDRAITLDPTDALAFINRGSAYQVLNDEERAIEDFGQAITLDPTDARGFTGRGYAYLRVEEYERAIEDFDQAIILDPTHPTVFADRGDSYYRLGEYEQAIEDLDRAITLDPNNATAFLSRSFVYRDLGEEELELADLIETLRLVDSGEVSIPPSDSNLQWARNRAEELS